LPGAPAARITARIWAMMPGKGVYGCVVS